MSIPSTLPTRNATGDVSAAKKYTEDHEAVVYDDATQIGTVTITNYAQSSLGDVVFVELPQEGSKIAQGGTCAVCTASGQNRTLTPLCRPDWRGGEREGSFGHRECNSAMEDRP